MVEEEVTAQRGGGGTMTTRDYTKYRLRTCQTLHWCELCATYIKIGEQYYDGGYGRRAHRICARDTKARQEHER